MDLDIQFGDLEESRPETQLRPDKNRHFAVSPYEDPAAHDLPIFVDVDVMKDMERHALTDTSVELGGVLLGGQYEDEDGNPFVVISDSLRAEHYEATKGSFKFTHDTWEQITRQREEFPPELQMVGWYHTHPDWGVFLSGMDMFICDNFFNKPLDVALVIDPCRGDRGMFMWTGDPTQRVRRCDGFHLTASRFRAEELNMFAAQLEQRIPMSTGSNYSHIAGSISPGGTPVVNVQQDRSPWLPLMALVMFITQTALLGFVAWMVLQPDQEKKKSPETVSIEKLNETLNDRFDEFEGKQIDEIRREAKIEVLNRVIESETGKADVVSGYAEAQTQIAQLRRDSVAYQLAKDQLDTQIAVLARQLKAKDDLIAEKDITIRNRQSDYDLLETNYRKLEQELVATQTRLKKHEPDTVVRKPEAGKPEKPEEDGTLWSSGWGLGLLVGGVALTLITAIVLGAMKMHAEEAPQSRGPENQPGGSDEAEFSIEDEPASGNSGNDPPPSANNS